MTVCRLSTETEKKTQLKSCSQQMFRIGITSAEIKLVRHVETGALVLSRPDVLAGIIRGLNEMESWISVFSIIIAGVIALLPCGEFELRERSCSFSRDGFVSAIESFYVFFLHVEFNVSHSNGSVAKASAHTVILLLGKQ